MNKFKKIALAIVLFAAPIGLCLGVASAQSFKRVVNEGEVVNSTIYAAGKTVEINGTVNGDVYCAGSDVSIDGIINGDVICAGQDVTISGTVNGSIRATGMNVTISASKVRSVSVAAQNFVLEKGAMISQDATLAGMSIKLDGSVGRDVTVGGQKITISGDIGRDIKSQQNSLMIKSGAVVGGSINYTSQDKADVSSGAKVIGGLHQTVPEKKAKKQANLFGVSLMFYLYSLAAMALLAVAIVLLAPKAVEAAAAVACKRWGLSILIGFLSGILIPAALILIGITFVGLPFVLVSLLLWGLLATVSGPVVAFMVGRLLLQRKGTNAIVVMLVGSLILTTICFIPIIGMVLLFVSYWLGAGAVVLAIKKYMPVPDYSIKSAK